MEWDQDNSSLAVPETTIPHQQSSQEIAVLFGDLSLNCDCKRFNSKRRQLIKNTRRFFFSLEPPEKVSYPKREASIPHFSKERNLERVSQHVLDTSFCCSKMHPSQRGRVTQTLKRFFSTGNKWEAHFAGVKSVETHSVMSPNTQTKASLLLADEHKPGQISHYSDTALE